MPFLTGFFSYFAGSKIPELMKKNLITEKKIEIQQASKNYEGRIVYMSDDACEALRIWLREKLPGKDYIFYGSGNRERLSYNRARQLFIKCTQKAGLSHKGYTLHCLRHTFASELLNAGMRLECLQVLLGHRNIEITRPTISPNASIGAATSRVTWSASRPIEITICGVI